MSQVPQPNTSARLFLHTLRFLRGRQIAGQVRMRVRAIFENPSSFPRRRVPDYPGCRWRPRTRFLPPGPQRNPECDLLRGSFTFLNDTREIGWPPRWTNDDFPRLWQYNLHYFDYLWALPYRDARVLVGDWISHHALGRRRVGWESYPTSLRLLNWCGYFFGEFARQVEEDAHFRDELWRSIYLQAEWLRRHLETHLLGNHLFENGAALALCGGCFAGEHAESWSRIGKAILTEQIREQIREDGGHFEHSPMYHVRIAYVLTALLNTGDRDLEMLVEAPLSRMMRALIPMCHPDGEIALLNDSAAGSYNQPDELLEHWRLVSGRRALDAQEERDVFSLPATGYYGARHDTGHYVICDAGAVGPDYLPGHAHGDIFSFELSLNGERVIVDSGVYTYEPDAMRRYCRSTRAHNTVEVDGEDQCEFWAAFRVARRGRPRDVEWRTTRDGFSLSAWHDGYERLAGRSRHRRQFAWHRQGALMVRDTVTSSRAVTATSRIHLHPECQIADLVGNTARIRHPRGEFSICFAGGGAGLGTEDSHYCPEFGKKVENRALVYSATGSDVEMGFFVATGHAGVSYDLVSGGYVGGRHYPW